MTCRTTYVCDKCGEEVTERSMIMVAPGTVKYVSWERLSPDLHFHVSCYERMTSADIQVKFSDAEAASWKRLMDDNRLPIEPWPDGREAQGND